MTTKNKALMWILAAILLAAASGCSAAPAETPTLIPTIDPKPTFDAISTQAVQTAVAEMTLNAPTSTPVTPTETPWPTVTQGPTDTPQPTATNTRVFIPWTHTPTVTLPPVGCAVTASSPTASVKPDQDFDGSWTLKNTGAQAWPRGDVDLRFIDGTKLHTGADLVDLNADVASGGSITVTIDMKAPSAKGSYTTEWSLYRGEGYICEFALTIKVE